MGFTLGEAFLLLGADRSRLDKDLKGAEAQTKTWVNGLGGIIKAGLTNAIGATLSLGINALLAPLDKLKEGLSGNAVFEKYQQQFAILVGTTELAKIRMDELAKFANATPFELPEVVKAGRIMETFGLTAPAATAHFQQMGIDIKTLVGDMAAGVGVGYDEMSSIIGRFNVGATGEAIERMQELGVVTRDELQAMGVEFSKSGEMITAPKEALDTLLQLTQQRFGGMMEAQSKTFEGMSSTLMDWVNGTIREVSKPIFDRLKDQLANVLEILSSDATQTAVRAFTSVIENGLSLVSSLFSFSLTDSINGFIEGLGSGLEQISFFLVRLRDEFMGLSAGAILDGVAGAINKVKDRLNTSLSELATRHGVIINQINNQIRVLAEQAGEKLAEIAQKYGEKALSVEDRYAKAKLDIERSLNQARVQFDSQAASNRKQHLEKMVDLERSMAEKRRGINEQISDKLFDLDERKRDIKDKLEEQQTSLTERHEQERADLIAELAAATTNEQRAAIQARIDAENTEYEKQAQKLDAKAQKEEAQLQQKSDREVQRLRDKLAREEAEYQFQTQRENQRAEETQQKLKQQHDQSVDDLRFRLSQEDQERQKQMAKINTERAEEEAKVTEANTKKLDELKARLEAENGAYDEQRQKLTDSANQEMVQLQEQANARVKALGTGLAGELGKAFEEGGFTGLFTTILGKVGTALTEGWNTYVKPTLDSWSTLFWNWVSGGEEGEGATQKTPGILSQLLTGISNYLTENWPTIKKSLSEWTDKFWGWLLGDEGNQGVIAKTGGEMGKLLTRIDTWAKSPETKKTLESIGQSIGDALVSGLNFLIKNQEKINQLVGDMLKAISTAVIASHQALVDIGTSLATGIVEGIVKYFTGAEVEGELRNTLRSAVQGAMQALFPASQIPGIAQAIGIPGFASGGIVPGPIGQPLLAIIHGGEEVRTPEQQRQESPLAALIDALQNLASEMRNNRGASDNRQYAITYKDRNPSSGIMDVRTLEAMG